MSSAVHLPNKIAGSLGGIVALSKSNFNRADTWCVAAIKPARCFSSDTAYVLLIEVGLKLKEMKE